MKKIETVVRAIARAGLNPLEFIIHPSLFGQPVTIEKRQQTSQVDSTSTLVIHPDDGIKRIAEQIREKFLYG